MSMAAETGEMGGAREESKDKRQETGDGAGFVV